MKKLSILFWLVTVGLALKLVFYDLQTSLASEASEQKNSAVSYLSHVLRQSNDIALYDQQFKAAASDLIAKGTCTYADFEAIGGWMKATTPDKKHLPIYFTHCGGMNKGGRLYLNVKTGEVFK